MVRSRFHSGTVTIRERDLSTEVGSVPNIAWTNGEIAKQGGDQQVENY